MTTKTKRKIIKIDEEKCDGCGMCVPACPEGALQIVNGKARLVKESYCDGLGACLGECPRGAITIEEREAEDFDEAAVKHHLAQEEPAAEEHHFACPSAMVRQFEKEGEAEVTEKETYALPSGLGHWPIQLTLVPPTAPFLHGADLMLVADCVPFAYADFHHDFLKGHALLVACPKLDDFQAHLRKLAEILRQAAVKSLTVVNMEVPCCFGLVHMAKQAIELSGQNIPFREITIGIKGELKSREE